MRTPTIAAVAIAKNEAARIRAWVKPLQSADRMFILDTGSTDETVTMARELGVTVALHLPREGFRFDHARNDVLERVREATDYVFWVDLDETVELVWRSKFETAIMQYGMQEIFSTTRLWGNLAYERPTIHKATRDWSWRRPVHEELVFHGGEQEYSPAPTGIEVTHDQDTSKDRSQYLPLMKIAVDQDPTDNQVAFWYARELLYRSDIPMAIARLREFSGRKDAWIIERMQACLHLAEIYNQMGSSGDSLQLRVLKQAGELAPWRREPLLAMARFQRVNRGSVVLGVDYARKALSIPHTMRPQDYLSAEETWDDEAIRKEFGIV